MPPPPPEPSPPPGTDAASPDSPPVVDLGGYAASLDRLRARLARDTTDVAPELRELEAFLAELEKCRADLRAQAEALAAEHGLRMTAQSRYRHLFDAVPVGLVQTDAQGLLLVANRTAHEQLGLRPTTAARPLALYASPSDRSVIRQLASAAPRASSQVGAELRFAASGMPGRAFLVSVVAERADEEPGDAREPAPPRPATLLWTLRELSRERRTESVLDGLRHGAAPGADPSAAVVRGVVDALAELDLEGDGPLRLLESMVRLVHPMLPEASGLAFVADLGGGAPLVAEHHDRSTDGAPLVSLLAADARHAVRSGRGLVGATLGTGNPQLLNDIRSDPRWPSLAPVARAYGLAGLLSFPIAVRGELTSVLVAASPDPGGLTAEHVDRLARVAPRIGTVLGNIAAYVGGRELASQLETAIISRAVIDQAKGVLMGALGIGPDQAFNELRRRSARKHLKVREVAAALLADPRGSLARSWPGEEDPAGR